MHLNLTFLNFHIQVKLNFPNIFMSSPFEDSLNKLLSSGLERRVDEV